MPHISHLHVDAISSHQHLNHSMLAINGKDVETFEEAPRGNSSHQQALQRFNSDVKIQHQAITTLKEANQAKLN